VSRPVEQYLDRYAEPEVRALDAMPGPLRWQDVVVIPACAENPAFLDRAPGPAGRSLLVLVINEPRSAPAAVTRRNRRLAAAVLERFEPRWSTASDTAGFALHLLSDQSAGRDVLLVDRFSEGRQLPEKGGVGHARKIGVDLAAALVHPGWIESPWIHCTDADVVLPGTYFEAGRSLPALAKDHAALIYPFFHADEADGPDAAEIVLATRLYELSLRYYVAAMKMAGSPYAFHTIGSTMVVSAKHYAMVRGFPKRAAGEDFYLLNKLAKVGNVLQLAAGPACEPIKIRSRRSGRVPFGTGAAVSRMTALSDPVSDYRFYHPMVFELLACWLRAIPAIWDARGRDPGSCIFPEVGAGRGFAAQQRCLLAGLEQAGVSRALAHAFRQSKNLQQFERQLTTWFDAFRTLKLIHSLRDGCAASIAYRDLEEHAVFQHLLAMDSDLRGSHTRLSRKIGAKRGDSGNRQA
jgi:hypothetical protein